MVAGVHTSHSRNLCLLPTEPEVFKQVGGRHLDIHPNTENENYVPGTYLPPAGPLATHVSCVFRRHCFGGATYVPTTHLASTPPLTDVCVFHDSCETEKSEGAREERQAPQAGVQGAAAKAEQVLFLSLCLLLTCCRWHERVALALNGLASRIPPFWVHTRGLFFSAALALSVAKICRLHRCLWEQNLHQNLDIFAQDMFPAGTLLVQTSSTAEYWQ